MARENDGVETRAEFPGRVIAQLLNISERRLQQLAKEGIVPKSGRGRYPLAGCIRGYVTYLQEQVDGGKDVIDYRQEKARGERVKAERMEFDLAVKRREYAPISMLEEVLDRVSSAAAARLDAITSRLHQRYPSMKATHLSAIKTEIAAARNSIAEIDPFTD